MKTKLFNDPTVYGEDSGRLLEAGWRCRLYRKQGVYRYAVEKLEGREWKWRCGGSGLRNIGVLLQEVATETDGTDIPLCCALPLARSVAAKIKKYERDNQGMKTKNPRRMKPLTEEQAGKAVAHWRRALTQAEARAASEAVRKAFADAGIEADVSGPVLLAKGETSVFGRVYRYSAGKCPLWGSLRFSHMGMGWASPFVVAKLKRPIKKKRCFALGGSTVKDLTEVRVRVELTAGHRTYEKACRKGADPREDYKDVKNSRERTEKIDADLRWECEVWDADVYTDGRERGYRRHGWGVYQPRDAFVFAPTQRGLHSRIAEVVDSMARELGIGKYAKAR